MIRKALFVVAALVVVYGFAQGVWFVTGLNRKLDLRALDPGGNG